MNFKKNNAIKKDLLDYSRTQYSSLNAFVKNLHYARGDFREESIAIKKIIDLFLVHEKFNEATDFFIYDILRLKNENIFENLILVLYDLKKKHFERIDIIRFLQNLLYNLILSELENNREFNKRLNTGPLYLKEFLDIRYKEKFKIEEDKNWIEQYRSLIDNTLRTLEGACKFILSSTKLDLGIKKIYLESFLAELNKSLDHVETLNNYDFPDSNYEELKSLKLGIIKEKKEFLKKLKLNLLFMILYQIDQNKIKRDFFEIAYKLYTSGNLSEELNKSIRPYSLSDLDWFNYDSFKGGAQMIAPFNFEQYRLVIFLYNYLNSGRKNTEIKGLARDNFTGSISDLERELDNFQLEFVRKYFNVSEKDCKHFKKIALKEIKERKTETKKLETKYVLESPLGEKYVDLFKKDCRAVWEERQKELKEIFIFKEKKANDDEKMFFGQHFLFPKEWFLESFDPNVGLARTNGKDVGSDQAESKYRRILELISLEFNKSKGDKIIKIKDLYSDLINNVESGKTYYLFYGGTEIYNLPNIEWLRHGIFVARLKTKGSEIYFCHTRISESLFFERGAFTLNQYGIKENKLEQDLLITIDNKFSKEEIQKILENSKNLKTKEEVLQNVKIKVLEKFETERNKGYKIIKFVT